MAFSSPKSTTLNVIASFWADSKPQKLIWSLDFGQKNSIFGCKTRQTVKLYRMLNKKKPRCNRCFAWTMVGDSSTMNRKWINTQILILKDREDFHKHQRSITFKETARLWRVVVYGWIQTLNDSDWETPIKNSNTTWKNPWNCIKKREIQLLFFNPSGA